VFVVDIRQGDEREKSVLERGSTVWWRKKLVDGDSCFQMHRQMCFAHCCCWLFSWMVFLEL